MLVSKQGSQSRPRLAPPLGETTTSTEIPTYTSVLRRWASTTAYTAMTMGHSPMSLENSASVKVAQQDNPHS